jgi:CBS-domain-containing membrane protein
LEKPVLVRDVYKIHGTASLTTSEDSSLEAIIEIYANRPDVRGIFLLDKQQRFVGMVSRLTIYKWAQFQLFKKSCDGISCSEVTEIVESAKAKHLSHGNWKSTGIKESTSLEKAFQQMMDFGEDILPVVDENGRVLGDLRLSELLQMAIKVGRLSR